jgi:hypothetical protein
VPVLSQAQIAQVARAAGLPGDPDIWAAVAMAESSGRTDVVNQIGCVGLWQINQPVHVKRHPQWTVAWLQNPMNNAKAAKEIYRSQGWAAWEAYTGPDGKGSDGPWRDYYKKGTGGVSPVFDWNDPFNLWPDEWGDAPGSPGGDKLNEWFGGDGSTDGELDLGFGSLGDVATGIGTMAEAVQKTAVWLGNARNWVRIGYVVGGGLLVALGLNIVARPLVEQLPTGRMAKMAKSLGKKGGKTAAKTTSSGGKKAAAKASSSEGGDGGE